LNSYDWPGNVRELRNIVHRAYVMTEGKIIRADVVQSLLPRAASVRRTGSKSGKPPRPRVTAPRVSAARKK
jgi:DNA-binding NtrC family response regulator